MLENTFQHGRKQIKTRNLFFSRTPRFRLKSGGSESSEIILENDRLTFKADRFKSGLLNIRQNLPDP